MSEKASAFWALCLETTEAEVHSTNEEHSTFLPTIRERHPSIGDQFCVALQHGDRAVHYHRLNGRTSPGFADQLTTPCLGSPRGGNEVWQRTSMKHSAQGLCGRDCTPTSRRFFRPKVARWQAYHGDPSFIVQCDSVRTLFRPLVLLDPVPLKLLVWPSTRSKGPNTTAQLVRAKEV